jgi:hypothetical protein
VYVGRIGRFFLLTPPNFIGGVRRKNKKILPTNTAYEDGAERSETSAYKIKTPGNHPKERIQHSEHGESLQSRRMEMIRRTNHVRNEEVSRGVKEERNIQQTIKRKKANWIGHFLRRNCLLKQFIEGKTEGWVEVTGRHGKRCKQLVDGLKETRGYWKLKEEALDRTL